MPAVLQNTNYPDGTTVYAYDATGYPSGFPGNNPPGTPVAEAEASGQTVEFSGLTDNVPYMAAGKVDGVWVYRRFIPNAEDPEAWHTKGPAGTDGTTIRSSHGKPSDSLGVNGDFCVDLDTGRFYGPKIGDVWGGYVDLEGPPGPTLPATLAELGGVLLSEEPGDPDNPVVVEDSDSRLSDARAPLAHGASHEAGGEDPLSFLAFRGEWDAEGSYFTNDVVKHNGETYLNIKADAAGHTPGASPTYWVFLGGLAYTAEDAANKGQANGYAELEAAGKVPVAQLPSALMEYQGAWNAATNTPALADGAGSNGDVYRVTAAAERNLGSGVIDFQVGDYAIYNGAVWEKSDTTDSVASVAGKKGAVTLVQADIEGLVAALSGKQPLDVGLTAIAALATDAFGRELLTKSTAAAIRTQVEAQYTIGGLFDVKSYGAKGDGATNDSTAINAAIAAAEAAGGGIVYFPAGTYIIDATLTLKAKVHLRGAGVEVTILKLKNGAKTDVIKTANYGAGGIADFSVRDLTIDGNLANNSTGNGLLIDGLRFQLDSLHIHHSAEDNLNVQSTGTGADEDAVGGYESVACHLKLYLAGGRNLRWDAQDGRLYDVEGICKDAESKKTNFLIDENAGVTKLTNCHAWGQAKYAMDFRISAYCIGCEAEGAVTANVRINCEGSLQWIGGKVFVDGSGHGKVGFLWETGKGSNSVIVGVRVKECTEGSFVFTGAGPGSVVDALVELPEGKTAISGTPDSTNRFNIVVRGGGTVGNAQTIKRATPTAEDTILDLRKDGDVKARFLLENNGLLAWGGGALSTDIFAYRTEAKTLRLEGRLDRTEREQSLASAGTITPSAWADVLVITGTTEVKKITATRAGHVLVLRWTSTAKLVAGENLKIPASISPTEHDSCIIHCDGTNWYLSSPIQSNP